MAREIIDDTPHNPPRLCNLCRHEIPADARVCQKCGHYQKWWWGISNLPTLLSFALVFVALAQVIVAGVQLEEASAANREAREALTRVLEVDRSLPVFDMAMRMRLTLRSGLVDLQRAEESPDSLKRKLASGLLRKISADYARITVRNYQLHAKDAMHNAAGFLSLPPNASKREVWSGLVGKIQREHNLNLVAAYFILLRQTTGIPFRMFDFCQVERWAARNKIQSK